MPVKLREFYWRELLDAKEAEAKVYQNAQTPSPPTRKTSRR
jgi:hypothetical protein